MTENIPETVISDDQLLDLWLTAWVAGAVDSQMEELTPESRAHVHGCAACTQGAIEYNKARLVELWEDPAARAEILECARKVLRREADVEPKFIAVHVPMGGAL